MARVKIKEYKAKQLIYPILNISMEMASYESNNSSKRLRDLSSDKTYVVKVDQGIKGRFKKGLVVLDKKTGEILDVLANLEKKGFSSFFVEEYIKHSSNFELYISVERVREGKKILYSKNGGVEIEKNKDTISQIILSDNKDVQKVSDYLGIDRNVLEKILGAFDKYYFSFLEINPLVLDKGKLYLLDLAVEVDSTAEFFVKGEWSSEDFVLDLKPKTREEEEIIKLSAKSQAAFKLDVINPNGSIFMLLSGGGASIVLADEVYNQGLSNNLANYGEYSGNPNAEETYIYSKNLLSLLILSKASKKVLIIGGGVANFTDIRITFKGIIKAMEEFKDQLKKQKVKVFVRRGGPYQKEGLKLMEKFLKEENLLGIVVGPEIVLTDIVIDGLNFIKND